MPGAGFAAPGIMFLNTWARQERLYLKSLLRAARAAGYTRYREGASGAFAASLVAAEVGYAPAEIETGDVWFYSAVVGRYLGDQDLAELDVRIDGEPVPVGDSRPEEAAARLLVAEMGARMSRKAERSFYHAELVRSFDEQREQTEAAVAAKLVALKPVLSGLIFRSETPWEALERVRDDEHAILVTNPPCYKNQYERVFDTGGRMTWASPTYKVWDTKTDGPAFMAAAESAKAMVLMLTMRPFGEAPSGVAYAAARPPQVSYLCCNRPEEASKLTGVKAGAASGLNMERLPYPTMGPDERVKETSQVRVVPIETKHARFYRDLWQHRMAGNAASYNFAVLVDGKLAGVAGYSSGPLDTPYNKKWDGHLLLTYCFGSPSRERRTKLVVMAACSRKTVDAICDTWTSARAKGLVTGNFTPEPEAKGFRGTPFKLVERKPHPVYQQELIYSAELTDWTLEECAARFAASEARRQPAGSAA